MPKFTHDCTHCTFLGHYAGCDVYTCGNDTSRTSIIARDGNDGPDYSSMPVSIFKELIRQGKVHFDYAPDQAMLSALAMRG